MQPALVELDDLAALHQAAGTAVFAACESDVFPCDALAFAVLDRSLGLLKGFCLLISNIGYSSAMALLRMQLDNILRLYGVLASGNAHDTAHRILQGEHLRDMKDRAGKRMTDSHLVRTLTRSAKWVPDVYSICSGYLHLSEQHIHYFLMRCKPDEQGKRIFAIGDEDDHVPEEAKRRLITAFVATTRGVTKLVTTWSEIRATHGANDVLKRKYNAVV